MGAGGGVSRQFLIFSPTEPLETCFMGKKTQVKGRNRRKLINFV